MYESGNENARLRNHLRGEGKSRKKVRITKEPEERKQEIIETALEVFSEKGYDATTIQDIVNRIGVSTGLCYRYFRSKAEIFAATSEYYASKAVDQIELPEENEGTAIDKFNIQVKQILEYTLKYAEFEAKYNEDPQIRASRLDDVADKMSDKMIPIIKQGVEEGFFQCEDVDKSTRFLIYGIIHTFHAGVPEENAKNYIISFIEFFRSIFARVLHAEEEIIGANWDFKGM